MWCINLVKNEIIKNFTQKKVLFFCIIMLLAITALGMYHKNNQKDPADWKSELNSKIIELQADNKEYESDLKANDGKDDFSKLMIDMNNENISIYSYAIENNIPHNVMTSWKFADKSTFFIILVLIFIIISASESMSSEFSSGTIRYLVIRPLKRWKIFVGKFTSLVSFSVILLLIMFVFSMIIGTLLFGFKGMNGVGLFYENGNVVDISIIKVVFIKYISELIKLSILLSLTLMISVLLRSGSLSLAVSLGVIIGGNLVVTALSKYQIMKYFFITSLDLQQFLPGNKPFTGMTIQFALAILIIHFILFNAISMVTFTKRDIY